MRLSDSRTSSEAHAAPPAADWLHAAGLTQARGNCGREPFAPGNFASFCPNCFCYVCDAPVANCDGPSGTYAVDKVPPRETGSRQGPAAACSRSAASPLPAI